MSENHPDGFLKYQRQPIGYRDPRERIGDYEEIYQPRWEEQQLREQSQRCMDCGTPTCMAGCPIGNIIPDWNDLVYRDHWKEALERLHATIIFPSSPVTPVRHRVSLPVYWRITTSRLPSKASNGPLSIRVGNKAGSSPNRLKSGPDIRSRSSEAVLRGWPPPSN